MSARLLRMPRLGETMEEGRIAGWLVGPGATFKRGDPIIEIETDKTVAEYPALGDGRLDETLAQAGETIPVGQPIARIDIGDGPDWTGADEDEGGASGSAPVAPGENPLAADAPTRSRPVDGPVRATPVARRLAKGNDLDIRSVPGTGRRGRVEKSDVFAALDSASPSKADAARARDLLFADLPRGRMAYARTAGKADGMTLLLHGFAGDHTTFASLASGLAGAGRSVVAVDLPGHGQTAIAAASAGDLAADLPALVDRIAPDGDIDIVAHSLGAVAAVAFASAGGSRVSSLTLIAPAGLGLEIDTAFIHGMANATTGGEIAHLLRRLTVAPVAISPVALEALAADMARKRLAALGRNVAGGAGQTVDILDAVEALARRVPVRVLFGLQDQIIPWQQVARLSPRVAIHLFAHSGHMPHWDQPRDVLDVLLSTQSEMRTGHERS